MWRECERCVRLLAKEGIASSTTTASTTSADAPSPTFGSASFRHWARRNHPDKGGDVARFQDVSRCCKAVHEERCVEKMKRERDFYRSTRRYTSSTANANGHVPGGGADDDDDDFTAQVFDHMIRDIALCGWSLAQSLGAIYVDVPVAPPVVRRRAQSSRRSVLGVKPVHLRVSVDGLLGPIDFFSPLHEVELGLSFPEGKQVRLDAVGVRWNLNKRGFKRRDKVSEDAKRASRASATVAPAAQTEGVSKANADLALAEEKKVEDLKTPSEARTTDAPTTGSSFLRRSAHGVLDGALSAGVRVVACEGSSGLVDMDPSERGASEVELFASWRSNTQWPLRVELGLLERGNRIRPRCRVMAEVSGLRWRRKPRPPWIPEDRPASDPADPHLRMRPGVAMAGRRLGAWWSHLTKWRRRGDNDNGNSNASASKDDVAVGVSRVGSVDKPVSQSCDPK